MKALKKLGEYRLYNVNGSHELWHGIQGRENSYLAGYVSDPENFHYAVDMAREEMAWLLAESI